MAPTISSDKLAKLICRDIRTVQRLAVQGILPRARHPDGTPMRGQFELIGSIQGFIRYLDTQLGLAALNDTDFRIERTKLIRCQRERLELETAVFRNELHRSDDVEAIMNDVLSGIKRLSSIRIRAPVSHNP
jgi:hypothetical protein